MIYSNQKNTKLCQKGKNLLKLFLFFPILLFSQELFTLPDEAEHLNYSLDKQIKTAKKSIYIFSSILNSYNTLKSLKSAGKRGVQINIITQKKLTKESKTSHLSLFKNITVHSLNSDFNLKGSLICIDDKELFLFSNNLDYKQLRQDSSFALHTQETCEKTFTTLLQRSSKKE